MCIARQGRHTPPARGGGVECVKTPRNFCIRGQCSPSIFPLSTADGTSTELQAEGVTKSISKELAAESVTKPEDENARGTVQRDTANITEQGPPKARVNSLFPDHQAPGDDLGDREGAQTKHRSLSVSGEGAVELSNVFDAAFVKKSKWSTLRNFVHSINSHKGGACSHVVNEVKAIAESTGTISSEDQIKEQITVMAQHVIDSESINHVTFFTLSLSPYCEKLKMDSSIIFQRQSRMSAKLFFDPTLGLTRSYLF